MTHPRSALNTKTLAIAVIAILRFAVASDLAEERIWLNAKINGHKARLCFDSGADNLILFRQGAQRLGLKFTEPDKTVLPRDHVRRGTTEECKLWLEGTLGNVRFDVVDLPHYQRIDVDGVVGWWFVRNNIFEIDANANRISCLPEVPQSAAGWVRLGIVRDGGFLMLQVPHQNAPDGILCIDTGSAGGVHLSPGKWRAWKQLHPHQPVTLQAFITPGDGLVVREEALADELAFGPAILTSVPVLEATPTEVACVGDKYEGELGLTALKQLDLIVDGQHGLAYLRAKTTPPSSYPHNRLGAVFVPKGSDADELFAQVAENSPAQEAGVRTGDILLKVDGTALTSTNYDGKRRFSARPGTKINFVLKRDGKVFSTTATLRDILSPSAVIKSAGGK